MHSADSAITVAHFIRGLPFPLILSWTDLRDSVAGVATPSGWPASRIGSSSVGRGRSGVLSSDASESGEWVDLAERLEWLDGGRLLVPGEAAIALAAGERRGVGAAAAAAAAARCAALRAQKEGSRRMPQMRHEVVKEYGQRVGYKRRHYTAVTVDKRSQAKQGGTKMMQGTGSASTKVTLCPFGPPGLGEPEEAPRYQRPVSPRIRASDAVTSATKGNRAEFDPAPRADPSSHDRAVEEGGEASPPFSSGLDDAGPGPVSVRLCASSRGRQPKRTGDAFQPQAGEPSQLSGLGSGSSRRRPRFLRPMPSARMSLGVVLQQPPTTTPCQASLTHISCTI